MIDLQTAIFDLEMLFHIRERILGIPLQVVKPGHRYFDSIFLYHRVHATILTGNRETGIVTIQFHRGRATPVVLEASVPPDNVLDCRT